MPGMKRMVLRHVGTLSMALFALLAAGIPGAALAGDTAAADALFSEAKALADKKKFAEACPKFDASYKLDKAVGTLMNLADCNEKIAKIATAWGQWGEAFDWLKREDDKRSSFAAKRRDALAPRLPKLAVKVAGASTTLDVYRDETRLEQGAYNSSLPVDPGPHSITVRRGEKVLKEERVEVAEKQSSSVEVDLSAIEKEFPPPPPEPPPVTTVIVAPPPTVQPQPPKSPQKAIGFVVGGIGVAGVLAAAAIEMGALSAAGSIEDSDACVNTYCSPKGLKAVDRAGSLADIGQWVGIGSLLVTGVGLTLVLTAPSSAPAEKPAELPSTRARRSPPRVEAFVTPYVGPLGGGISVTGRL